MNNIFDTSISYYANVKDKVGTETTLHKFLFCDHYREQIETIRSLTDEEQQKSLKRQLPLATISGTFAPTRKAENLVAHSNLLCIDIDKKGNMGVTWFDDLKHEWHNIPQILYAAHSVRGIGWFTIFHIAYPEKHKSQFEALRQDFAHEGLVIDESCKDVIRMRTISYDLEPYVNEDATLYTKIWVESMPKFKNQYDGDDDMEKVERCCRIIADCGIDITTTYDDWFHVGVALASLGECGSSLFHLVSSQNANYKATETDKKFDNLLRNISSINIGTFYHICSLYGINWEGGLAMKVEITSFNNKFFEYLYYICFDQEKLEAMMNRYPIGSTEQNEPIFWHINVENKIINGHIITMDSDTGNVHDESWYYQDKRHTCLFGEDLLDNLPSQTVALVKSEMTAAIMSCFPTPYIWLATGKDNVAISDLSPLEGRSVVVFPDKGEYHRWKDALGTIPNLQFHVSDVIEKPQGDCHNITYMVFYQQPLRLSDEEAALMRMEEISPQSCFACQGS